MGQNIEAVLRELKTPEVRKIIHPDGFSLSVPGVAAYKEWGPKVKGQRQFLFHWNPNTALGLQSHLFKLSPDHNWEKIENLPASVRAAAASLSTEPARYDDCYQFEVEELELSGVLVPGVCATLEWGPHIPVDNDESWHQYCRDFNGLVPVRRDIIQPIMGYVDGRWREVTHPYQKTAQVVESLVRYFQARDAKNERSMERHLGVIKRTRIRIFA